MMQLFSLCLSLIGCVLNNLNGRERTVIIAPPTNRWLNFMDYTFRNSFSLSWLSQQFKDHMFQRYFATGLSRFPFHLNAWRSHRQANQHTQLRNNTNNNKTSVSIKKMRKILRNNWKFKTRNFGSHRLLMLPAGLTGLGWRRDILVARHTLSRPFAYSHVIFHAIKIADPIFYPVFFSCLLATLINLCMSEVRVCNITTLHYSKTYCSKCFKVVQCIARALKINWRVPRASMAFIHWYCSCCGGCLWKSGGVGVYQKMNHTWYKRLLTISI